MASSTLVRQVGSAHHRGIRLSDLPNNSDMRRLDWLVAPVHSPGWIVSDAEFGAAAPSDSTPPRSAGFKYGSPGYVGKYTGNVIYSAIGNDGDVLEVRWNGQNWQFELDTGAALAGEGRIRVDISAAGTVTASRDAMVAAMQAHFGRDAVRARDVLATVGISFYGPRVIGFTAGGAFGTANLGQDPDAFDGPGSNHLRNMRPPSGFPNLCYTIDGATEDGECILEVTGLDARLDEYVERVRLDFASGLTRHWGYVGWRQITSIEVIQASDNADAELYIGWNLNVRRTVQIDLLTTYVGGANDILSITTGTQTRTFGVVLGDVNFLPGATTQDTGVNLANAIAGEVALGNLDATLHVTTDWPQNNGVDANTTIAISIEDRDVALTVVATTNAGPSYSALDAVTYWDDPGEDDDWCLGFPFEFVYDDRLDNREEWDRDPTRFKVHNIDGFNWLDLNAWAWNQAQTVWAQKGRLHGYITGTDVAGGAPTTTSKLMGGWFGEPFHSAYNHPIFEGGLLSPDFDAPDNLKALNTWFPPQYARPLCSAGTDNDDPVNQAQYRLYVFRLNNRSKIPAFQHGEGS